MHIHFIGIGGIGISALARYFLARGDEVSGSDTAESEIVESLRKLGAKIPPSLPFTKGGTNIKSPPASFLQRGEHVDLVIYSAAVPDDDPELAAARSLNIKTQKYAQALGELTKEKFTIAISGIHGKSTTTAMIGLILERAGLDPTVIVGTKVEWGIPQNPPQPSLPTGQAGLKGGGRGDFIGASNFRMGQSQYLVIEADEYDRSFLNYWPQILVLLNIEEEHLDTYTGGLPDIMRTFGEYTSYLPEDGVLVANEEDENISKLILGESPAPTVSSPRQEGERQMGRNFRVINFGATEIKGLNLKIPGRHNLSNANAALAVARILGVDEKIAVEALNDFSGTWRRMEHKGDFNGAKIYDDYGHHPTEIKATLAGARELLSSSTLKRGSKGNLNPSQPPFKKGGENRLWCVFQPHQYQRTYNLFDRFVSAFDSADKVILLPIYSVAGRESEEIKKQVNSEKLAESLNVERKAQSEESVLYMDSFEKAETYLRENLKPGDVCVIMGAGDICKLTSRLFQAGKKSV